MENWISGLLCQYYRDILQREWPLQKISLFHGCQGGSITAGMYLLNE